MVIIIRHDYAVFVGFIDNNSEVEHSVAQKSDEACNTWADSMSDEDDSIQVFCFFISCDIDVFMNINYLWTVLSLGRVQCLCSIEANK